MGTGENIIIKGKYKIINFYKAGGFGQIFFAKHTSKGYDVAIKVVSFIYKK